MGKEAVMAKKSTVPKSARSNKPAQTKNAGKSSAKAISSKGVVAKKQADKKPKDSPEKQAMNAEAKARVKFLSSLLAKMRAQIKAERAEAPPSLADLNTNIGQAQAAVTRIQADIEEGKLRAKKLKIEIDEWKLWYQRLPENGKPLGELKLKIEIDQRAAEIDAVGKQIDQLRLSERQAWGELEHAKQRLAAVEAGVYNLPLKEDPRLKGLQAAHAEAVAALEKLQA
jgi:hypothetical protein